MSIRFQADADFNQTILWAAIRKEPTLDFLTAMQGGLIGLRDPIVIAKAAESERILVTHDKRTMPRHFAQFVAHNSSPGLLIVPQWLPIGAAIEDLLLIHGATEMEDWLSRIAYLPL
jgi:hypothetical protein